MQVFANRGCRWTILASWIVVTWLASMISYAQSNAVLYQGARLIIGDASAPIETGEFLSPKRTDKCDRPQRLDPGAYRSD